MAMRSSGEEPRCFEELQSASDIRTGRRLRDAWKDLRHHFGKRQELDGIAAQCLSKPLLVLPFGTITQQAGDRSDVGKRMRARLEEDGVAESLAPLWYHEFPKRFPRLTAGPDLVVVQFCKL